MKRCPLCLAILAIPALNPARHGSLLFDHTAESCERATLQRIVALEQVNARDGGQLRQQEGVLAQLARWLGPMHDIAAVGERWLAHRKKRMEDIERLRGVLGTQEREHPLWQAERELAEVVRVIVEQVRSGT